MGRIALFTGLFFLMATQGYSQAIEYGLFVGTANYMGDLVEKSVDWQTTKESGALFFRYNFSPYFAGRLQLSQAVVRGTDVHATERLRKLRNLSFESPITEGAMLAEFSPLGFNPVHARNKKISPYVFLGIGVFHFNPIAWYKGKYYALHDLSTEGQGFPEYPARQPYKLTQMCYPFGLGARYNMNRHWNVGVELHATKTFTDYIDDVSGNYADPDLILARKGPTAMGLADRRPEVGATPINNYNIPRGNPKNKDWYFFMGLTLSYMPHQFTCFNY